MFWRPLLATPEATCPSPLNGAVPPIGLESLSVGQMMYNEMLVKMREELDGTVVARDRPPARLYLPEEWCPTMPAPDRVELPGMLAGLLGTSPLGRLLYSCSTGELIWLLELEAYSTLRNAAGTYDDAHLHKDFKQAGQHGKAGQMRVKGTDEVTLMGDVPQCVGVACCFWTCRGF